MWAMHVWTSALSFTIWLPDIRLLSSGLAARTFTLRANLPAGDHPSETQACKDLPFSSCFLLNHFSNYNNSASLETLWLGGRGEGAGLSPAECVQHLTSREQGSWLFCLLSNVHDCFFTSWAVRHFPLHWGLRILIVVSLNPAVHLPTALRCGDTLCCCQDPSSVLLGWTMLGMPRTLLPQRPLFFFWFGLMRREHTHADRLGSFLWTVRNSSTWIKRCMSHRFLSRRSLQTRSCIFLLAG